MGVIERRMTKTATYGNPKTVWIARRVYRECNRGRMMKGGCWLVRSLCLINWGVGMQFYREERFGLMGLYADGSGSVLWANHFGLASTLIIITNIYGAPHLPP